MKTLLAASEGGHLVELYLLADRIGLTKDCTWVTFDSPQSRSLLAGQEVHFAPFAGTRDLGGTLRAAIWAQSFLRANRFDTAVSTGASIALALLPLAARRGTDCYYVESATLPHGPSLTGRLLQPFRSINLRTQHAGWADRRWEYAVSVFDGFEPFLAGPELSYPQRLVVSLGMHKGFGFRRLLERLVRIIPGDTEVFWQVGSTDATGLGIQSRQIVPPAELLRVIADSDAVVTHAGVGSAIWALTAGKRPVFVPRRREFKEHINNHQVSIAAELGRRELVFHLEADELQWEDIIRAVPWRVTHDGRIESLLRALQAT
jgi:UDP-N-acetylglucosamine transferase subunit ALG13